MTLPKKPTTETILRSCVQTLDDVLLPEISSEWGRYSGDLLRASLEYAIALQSDDRTEQQHAALAAALETLRPSVERTGRSAFVAALDQASVFEAASRLLVAAQREPGALADEVRAALRPLLLEQLDQEFAAALPLLAAFAKNMQADR